MRKLSTVLVTTILFASLAACAEAPTVTPPPPSVPLSLTDTPAPTRTRPVVQQPAATATAVPLEATEPPVTQTATSAQTVQTRPPAAAASPIPPRDTAVPPVEETQPPPPAIPELPCDRAAAGNPMDISIPDDTVMLPGQTFSKTWRLVNTGACTWTEEYELVWFSGERFSSVPEHALPYPVQPGQTVDLTVDMTAPDQPGLYQSHWKLRGTAGQLFGIGPSGDAPIWARIQVRPGESTTVPEPPTPLPTPQVHSSGSARLLPGDNLDLDNNLTSAGANADLLFSQEAGGSYLLSPQNGGMIGPFGSGTPGMTACQTSSLTGLPVPLDGIAGGSTACVRTSLGLPGWIRITQLDSTTGELLLELLTWATP